MTEALCCLIPCDLEEIPFGEVTTRLYNRAYNVEIKKKDRTRS
jgi:hypothetical protein